MKTYKVAVTRDGKWWMIAIPGVDGLTQARRLADVEAEAIDYIAVTLEIPDDDITVDIDVRVGDIDATAEAGIVADLSRRAAEAASEHSAAARVLANQLANAKVPARDIGEILGITHQRVSQLLVQIEDAPTESDVAR